MTKFDLLVGLYYFIAMTNCILNSTSLRDVIFSKKWKLTTDFNKSQTLFSRRVKQLEEEVTLVGNNLRSLEISEGKASEREDTYENQIKTLETQLEEVSSCRKIVKVSLSLLVFVHKY